MNKRRLFFIVAILVLLGAGVALLKFMWLGINPSRKDSQVETPTIVQPTQPTSTLLSQTNPAPKPFPDDSRFEVQLLYKLALAAHFYNFNSEIVYHKTNDRPRMIDLGTPTHGASIMRGLVTRAYSYCDGSDVRRKPEAAQEWYQCTGKWSKEEAIAETFKILERLGETEVLARLRDGQQECEPAEFRLPTPDGQMVKVTPFYKVRLLTKENRTLVEAEYRIGTNGPVGLTDWYFWP